MTSNEKTNFKSESNSQRPIFLPQRPPPPPPIQLESSTPFEDISILSKTETLPTLTEISNFNVEENRDTLLSQFTNLFDSFDYEIIRNKVLNLEMTKCPFITVLWRIFLHCLPRDSTQWNQVIDGSRENYNTLVEKYIPSKEKIRKHNVDINDHHPLSQEENSPWNQYYVYKDLKENIYQDVIRTCQEIPFFQQKQVLDLLLTVLFIHSRHYEQTLPYRQGMHEILAVIVHLLHLESVTINEYSESNEIMKKLYDPMHLAHDAYAIYEKIMDHLQQFYDFKSNNLGTRQYMGMHNQKRILFQQRHDIQVQMNDTVMRVNSIFERLKEFDLPLYNKLQDLAIEPPVYGIRWLRLLFGREISFNSIPILWTIIFGYDECFSFVDYFFLALLIEVGQTFKKNTVLEYSLCLQSLMQPNIDSDVEIIIQKALSLEKMTRTKQTTNSSSNRPVQQMDNRSLIAEIQKPVSSAPKVSQNPLFESIKSNIATSFISLTQIPKSNFSNVIDGAEMSPNPGKQIREQFENNAELQKYCAHFMNQFIQRIRKGLSDLELPNEELLLQLNGLEQIANILQGTLTFDDNSLQALLNYKYKDEPMKNVEDTVQL